MIKNIGPINSVGKNSPELRKVKNSVSKKNFRSSLKKTGKITAGALLALTLITGGTKEFGPKDIDFFSQQNPIVKFVNDVFGLNKDVKKNFKIVGTKIIDPDGKEFIPKGINIPGPHYWDTCAVIKDVDNIVDKWKFNMVRVDARILAKNGSNANNDLDKIIDTFTKRKVVVAFSVHDKTGDHFEGKELDYLKQYYMNLAQKYKDNPYVWIDIMNEPGNKVDRKNDSLWINEHKQVLRAIKHTGWNNVCIVEDLDYAAAGAEYGIKNSCITRFGKEIKSKSNNVLFSIHVYQGWNRRKLARLYEMAKKNNLALLVGEYGSESQFHYTIPETEAMFYESKKYKIGAVAWKWAGTIYPWGTGLDRNYLTKPIDGKGDGGGYWTAYDSTGTPTNLTYLGKRIWDYTHDK